MGEEEAGAGLGERVEEDQLYERNWPVEPHIDGFADGPDIGMKIRVEGGVHGGDLNVSHLHRHRVNR